MNEIGQTYSRDAFIDATISKQVQIKMLKGFLDLVMLKFLDAEPMHGYRLIVKIRKTFGTYFGPSTVYPLLGLLEQKGYVESSWSMTTARPRKLYRLTHQGKSLLQCSESTLEFIRQKLGE
jgi:DNA-binding PadR family transcriptional regulator